MSPDLPNWLGSVKGSVERVQIDGRQWYKSKKPITASTVKLGDVPHGARLDIELSRPATISAGEVHPSAKLILHCPPSALTTIDAGFAEVEIQSTERAGGGTQVRLILGAHEMRLTLTGESFRLAGTSGLGKPTLQVHTRSSACSLSVQANATVTHVTADGALKFNLQHNEGLERIETIGDLNL